MTDHYSAAQSRADCLPEVATLARLLNARGWSITTAESCTGGLVAAALTDMSGSSAWFRQGIVSYSNEAKSALLGVDEQLLLRHGAVSEAVVLAMAAGAARRAAAEVAVSVSGIAGPDGGSEQKPVGTVWIGWWVKGSKPVAQHTIFNGDRHEVRRAAVAAALGGTIRALENCNNDEE